MLVCRGKQSSSCQGSWRMALACVLCLVVGRCRPLVGQGLFLAACRDSTSRSWRCMTVVLVLLLLSEGDVLSVRRKSVNRRLCVGRRRYQRMLHAVVMLPILGWKLCLVAQHASEPWMRTASLPLTERSVKSAKVVNDMSQVNITGNVRQLSTPKMILPS